MHDVTDLVMAIKKAAMDAVNTSQPSDFCFGKVTSTNPLKISIEQKMTLGSAQLILTKSVTDYTTTVTVNWSTESQGGGDGESSSTSQNHSIKGEKQMTIHNALKVGEEVVLLKQKGGQKYLVIDRVIKT